MDQTELRINEKIQQNIQAGGEIPPYTAEVQERLVGRLVSCEDRLNQLFGDVINPDRRNIAPQTQFLDAPHFFEEAILGEREVPRDIRELARLFINTMDTRGQRSFDGRKVMVHTTVYSPDTEPRQATEAESFATARHEMVHGKVEPILKQITERKWERKTGCKTVVTVDGQITEAKHTTAYEAQTNALSVISGHPEIDSWGQVFRTYLAERSVNNDDYAFGLSSISRVVELAFPDFQEGVRFLGRMYFRCEGQKFFDGLKAWIAQRHPEEEVMAAYDSFVKASEADNPEAMTVAVAKVVRLATSQ